MDGWSSSQSFAPLFTQSLSLCLGDAIHSLTHSLTHSHHKKEREEKRGWKKKKKEVPHYIHSHTHNPFVPLIQPNIIQPTHLQPISRSQVNELLQFLNILKHFILLLQNPPPPTSLLFTLPLPPLFVFFYIFASFPFSCFSLLLIDSFTSVRILNQRGSCLYSIPRLLVSPHPNSAHDNLSETSDLITPLPLIHQIQNTKRPCFVPDKLRCLRYSQQFLSNKTAKVTG